MTHTRVFKAGAGLSRRGEWRQEDPKVKSYRVEERLLLLRVGTGRRARREDTPCPERGWQGCKAVLEQHEGSRGRGGPRQEGLEEAPGDAGGWDCVEGSAETRACNAASSAAPSMSQGPPGRRVPCAGEGDSHPTGELQSLAVPPPALLLSVDTPRLSARV